MISIGFDVYSYGMISTSTLYRLSGKYPKPDEYAELADSHAMIGGEAANSSIVLGKLGVKVRLDGNWLGKDNQGERTLDILNGFQIDTRRLQLQDGYRGVEEVVLADAKTRTVLGTYGRLLSGERQWDQPLPEDIQDARLVNLDPFFKEESLTVSRMCKKYHKPYVTVDCTYTDEIAVMATVVIISGEFRNSAYQGWEKEKLFAEYLQAVNGLVIFTSGESEILYGKRGEKIQRCRPFRANPVDTAGAGDSFRAGIVYGMLQGWPEDKSIRFAAALAAYICESFPGVLNCPTYEELMRFVEKKGERI